MAKKQKKARKTDKRQNPSAKVAHRATKKDANLAKPYGKKKRKKARPRQPKPPPREISVLDAVDEAYMEIEALAQEMRDWADSMEDKFSGTQKYDSVNTTADTLENLSNPTQSSLVDAGAGPEYGFLMQVKITVQDPTPRVRGFSRSARCGQATDLLEQVMTALEEFEDNEKYSATEREKADELHREIDDAVGELQGCDFPGMYG